MFIGFNLSVGSPLRVAATFKSLQGRMYSYSINTISNSRVLRISRNINKGIIYCRIQYKVPQNNAKVI